MEKLLFTLSVPTIISMMVTNIYNLVDTAFVGTLGTSESGATGIDPVRSEILVELIVVNGR